MAFPFGSSIGMPGSRRNRRRTRYAERLRQCAPAAARGGARPSGRLLFDPLEPRLLLSADVLSVNLAQGALALQDHSLVVEMVTSTVQVGTSTQAVQRVEVVDQAQNNAVLAVGNLSVITQVNITGNAASTNNDTVTINADSFGGLALPATTFVGGGGTNSLVIDHNAAPGSASELWTLTGPKSGTATGAANVSFFNVNNLVGGAGTDILTSTAGSNSWTVTGNGSGTAGSFGFSGFEGIQAGATGNNTFVFSPGGALSAGISGSASGTNTLTIKGAAAGTETWQLTSPHAGTASGSTNVTFSNIESLTGSGTDALALDGTYNSAVISQTGDDAGKMTLDGQTVSYSGIAPSLASATIANIAIDLPNNNANGVLAAAPPGTMTFTNDGEVFGFADPASLTISFGNGNGTVDISSLSSAFAAAVTVNGGNGTDKLIVNANSITQPGPWSIFFKGGTGTGVLNIAHATGTETWQLTGSESGQATGLVAVSFSNVADLIGGNGEDILSGPTANTPWNVTGLGTGNVDGVSFSGFDELLGPRNSGALLLLGTAAATDLTFNLPDGGDNAMLSAGAAGSMQLTDQDETFTFVDPTGTLAINLGAGTNTLTVNSLDPAFTGALTITGGTGSNSYVVNAGTFSGATLPAISLNGAVANLTVNLPDGGDDASLSAGAAGTMQLSDQGETFTFADPTGNLAVNLGNGADTLTVNSLDSAFTGTLAITGGAGSNSVAIDADAFSAMTTPPAISFTGVGTANSLEIDHSAGSETWQLSSTVTDAGQATGLVTVSFTDVQNLIGGGGADTLSGPTADTTWNVTGLDSGTVNGINFSGFGNLQGADNNYATFVIAQGGMLLGGVDGGAGDLGLLVADGTYTSEVITATGAHAGSLTLDGSTFQYAGLAPINLGTAANVTFDIDDMLTGNATLSAGTSGNLVLSAPGIAETTTFADPTTSLTINLTGNVTLTINSLDPGFAAALTIDSPNNNIDSFEAGVGLGADFLLDQTTVNIDGNVSTNGGAIFINALTVNIANNVTINTQSATGASGSFSIEGDTNSFEGPHSVTIGSGVVIDTTGLGGAAGGITIAVLDIDYRALELPIFYSDKSVGISVNGTSAAGDTIEGGNVSITAEAEDLSLPGEIPTWAASFTSTLGALFEQLPGDLLSAATGLDASVVLRGANANITVTDASITSSGSVAIESTTEVQTYVQAISVGTNAAGFSVAVGYSQATSTVTTTVTGDSTITAQKDITISATGTVKVKSTARASSNLIGNINSNGASFAIALGYTHLTDTAEVDSGVTLNAVTGNIAVTATGSDQLQTSAATAGFVDGVTGVAVGLGIDLAAVNAYLNGTATAGGTITGSAGPIFNPTQANVVNTVTNALYIPDNGLTTGDEITYTTNGTPIGGLVNGQTYYVVVLDANDIQLANGPVDILDPSGTNPLSTQTLTTVDNLDFNLDAINSSNNSIQLNDNGFNQGDSVTYNDNGNTPIQGLTNGATYLVNVLDDNDFQLINPTNGQVVQIAQGAALGLQTFTDTTGGTNAQQLNLAAIDTTNNAIEVLNNGFTNGEDLNYQSLVDNGADQIGGLTNGNDYTVQVLNANEFQLLDPTNNNQVVQLSDPGTSVQSFTYTGEVFGFNPTSTAIGGAVNPVSSYITLPGNDLVTGQAVVYEVDPNISTTVMTPTQIADPNNPGQFIQGPDASVTVADPEIGGLDQGSIYYVVKIDANTIALTDNPAAAALAQPIVFGSTGTGTNSQLVTGTTTAGIGVTAKLTTKDAESAKPVTGGKFNWSQYVSNGLTSSDVTLAALFGNAAATTGKYNVTDEDGNSVENKIQNNNFSTAGGIAFNFVDHTCYAEVGNLGTTVLKTSGDVSVTSTDTETYQEVAQSSVSKPSGSTGTAVAVSIAFGLFTNDTEATVFGDSTIDASGTLSVTSTLTYPPITPISPSQWGAQQLANLESSGISTITNYLDGTLGFASDFLNTWSIAGGKAADIQEPDPKKPGQFKTQGTASSLSGSLAINVFQNTSNAIIESGAKINQNPAYQTSTQSVSVTATTTIMTLDVAGLGKWTLNPFAIIGKGTTEDNRGFVNQLKGGDILALGGSAGGSAFGGAILVSVLLDSTEALIEPGVMVRIGPTGSLDLDADEEITRVDVSQSGGYSQNQTNEATDFAGSLLGYGQNSTTIAGIEANNSQGADVTGGGAVNITANTGGVQVSVAGTIIFAGGGSTGIGVSVMVNAIVRDTAAFIGAGPTGDPDTTPNAFSTLDVGNITMSATTGGTIVAVAIAGTVTQNSTPASGAMDNVLNGASPPNAQAPSVSSGAGFAGSGAVDVFLDTTLAYININTASANTVGALSLSSDDDQLVVNLTGGVDISIKAGSNTTGSTQVGGAISVNQDTDDTEAFIKGPDLTSSGAVTLTATNEGHLDAFSAALSAATTNSNTYAGSISINRVVDTTDAIFDSGTLTAASLSLTATEDPTILAIGGGASFTAGQKGIGGAVGFNQIVGTTMAAIEGTNARSTVNLTGNLNINASNAATITAVGVSAGVSTGAGSQAGAFTIGINIISTNTAVFTRDESDGLIAEINNADVTTTGGSVTISATDDSIIGSFAGAFGVATTGSAFGVGLSWNQIDLNVDAEVNNAAVHASGGVSITAMSTQTNGILGSKITSLAVGAAVSGNTAIGVNVSVNGIVDTISAQVDTGSTVTSGGTVALDAEDDSTISTLVGGVAISTKGTGAGAALGANYIDNEVTATINASTVHGNGGDVTITAFEGADIQALAVGLEGGQNNAAGGSIAVSVITDTVVASIAGAATVTASGNVRVKSTNNATIGTLAGQVAIGGKVGVGISSATAVIVNNNSAFIAGEADVTGDGGVTINANTTETPSVFAIGGALGLSTAGVAGTLTVTTVNDNTQAYVASPTSAAGFVQGGTGAGSSGDVTIDAESTFNLLGTAGALAFGGKAGVGVGVDTGVVTRNTYAYIGANAKVYADGSVAITANATETITSVSVAGAFSGNVAVGLTAGVSVLNLTTNAYIDSGATVIAKNNVLVSAEDQTTSTLVSGNLEGSGSVAVGVGAGISVLTKNTNAYIASDAVVTALAQGTSIMANTGTFGTPTGTDSAAPADNVEFTTADFTGNEIFAANDGLNTGDEVVYDGAGLPLGGLNSGGEYYVIAVDANDFELAASYADAMAGNAITLSAGQTSPTDQHTVERLSQIGVPSVSTSNVSSTTPIDLSSIADNLEGPPVQAARQGVVVVAVSTNHMDTAGAAGGGSGSVAVQVAGAVAVHTINTVAEIQSGAQINQTDDSGANANQSVYVDAGRTYHDLALGLGASFAGTAAISPAISIPVLLGNTEAFILGPTSGTETMVSAAQDVEVSALALSDFIGVAVGISGSGEVAIAGSVTVIDVNTTTEAAINGLAEVEAGGNVLVNAYDTTTAYAIAGAVGIGIGGGAGAGAFAVSIIDKNTDAYIENDATVDADGNGTNTLTGIMTGSLNAQQSIVGVAVQAASNEKLINVAGSGAGGLYVGIAGAVDVEETNANTVAAIQNGAMVNQKDAGTANTLQTVAVGASDDLTITAVAGAVGGAVVGIGAGVDVEIDPRQCGSLHRRWRHHGAGGKRCRGRRAHRAHLAVGRDRGRRRRLCARRRHFGDNGRRRLQRQLLGRRRERRQLLLKLPQRQQRQWVAGQHRHFDQPVDDGR